LDLGFSEVLVILVFALLLFGPDKLPEMARKLGKYYAQLMKYKEFLDEEIRKGMFEVDMEYEGKKKKRKKTIKKIEETEEPEDGVIDEDLRSIAESLGIEVEGKSREEVLKEIKEKVSKEKVSGDKSDGE